MASYTRKVGSTFAVKLTYRVGGIPQDLTAAGVTIASSLGNLNGRRIDLPPVEVDQAANPGQIIFRCETDDFNVGTWRWDAVCVDSNGFVLYTQTVDFKFIDRVTPLPEAGA